MYWNSQRGSASVLFTVGSYANVHNFTTCEKAMQTCMILQPVKLLLRVHLQGTHQK